MYYHYLKNVIVIIIIIINTLSERNNKLHWISVNSVLVSECHDPSGKFADPTDVFGYFECIQGTTVKRKCPTEQKWNQLEKICKLILSKIQF